MSKPSLAAIILCGLICFFSTAVSATSIPITGSFQQGFDEFLGDGSINGPGLTLFQGTPDGLGSIGTCVPGAVCNFSTVIGSAAPFCMFCTGFSSGTLGNKTADFLDPNLTISGSAFFPGGDTLTMPITITGTIVGYALNCPGSLGTGCTLGPVEFNLNIVGTGTATLTFGVLGESNIYGMDATFSGTATVVPEPISLVLTGTGFLGIWTRKRALVSRPIP